MLTKPDARTAIQSLRSTTCPSCGGPKKRAHTLCRREFFKLPRSMRDALYARVREGYEEAIAEALTFLKRTKFIEPPSAATPAASPNCASLPDKPCEICGKAKVTGQCEHCMRLVCGRCQADHYCPMSQITG